MRVKRDHLTLLLNQLYDRGDNRFTVSHPCDKIGDLITIDLDEPDESVVRFDLDREGYANASNEAELAYGHEIKTDLPSREDYSNAFVASGVVPLVNIGEVTNFLDRYGDPDLMAGHPPVFAGFDTNILPWRIDRILGLRKSDVGVGYVNGLVLATGVRDELDWDVKCHDVDPYTDVYGEVANAYWNQPIGSGRKSRIGLSTYREIRDIQQAAEVDSDIGDEAIIDAYENWQNDYRGQVMLFSNDRNFVELARSHTLLAQHIQLPTELPTKTIATWEEIEQLIYLLTTIFGILELPGVSLLGVWSGKKSIDWQQERLKLEPRSPVLEEELVGALTIVENHASLKNK